MDIQKYYEILGVNENASDEELNYAYNVKKTQYENDRFLEGEAGNEAAKKLTELKSAYSFIVDYRKEIVSSDDRGAAFSTVDGFIKSGKINEAQAELDKFSERSAEWHYLQSVVFYKKNWINESKKQLEIAMQMDGVNDKYKNAYDKLCRQMDYNAKNSQKNGNGEWNRSGSGNNQNAGRTYEEPTDMMGGDSCFDFCCRLAICNMLCNCCCGGGR